MNEDSRIQNLVNTMLDLGIQIHVIHGKLHLAGPPNVLDPEAIHKVMMDEEKIVDYLKKFHDSVSRASAQAQKTFNSEMVKEMSKSKNVYKPDFVKYVDSECRTFVHERQNLDDRKGIASRPIRCETWRPIYGSAGNLSETNEGWCNCGACYLIWDEE